MKRIILLLTLFASISTFLTAQNNNLNGQSTNGMLEVESLMQEADYIFEGTVVGKEICHYCTPKVVSTIVKVEKQLKGTDITYGSIELVNMADAEVAQLKKGHKGVFIANQVGESFFQQIKKDLSYYDMYGDLSWFNEEDLAKLKDKVNSNKFYDGNLNNQQLLTGTCLLYDKESTGKIVLKYNDFKVFEGEESNAFFENKLGGEATILEVDKLDMNSIVDTKKCKDSNEFYEDISNYFSSSNEYKDNVFEIEKSQKVLGADVLRITHYYKGYQVENSYILLTEKNNCVVKAAGSPITFSRPVADLISRESALTIAVNTIREKENKDDFSKKVDSDFYTKMELVWSIPKNSDKYYEISQTDYELVYKFNVGSYEVKINAENGCMFSLNNQDRHCANHEDYNFATNYNGDRSIDAQTFVGGFELTNNCDIIDCFYPDNSDLAIEIAV